MEINYLDNCEKRRCICNLKQFKTLFRVHMVRLKIISLYIYKDLRLKTYESRDHYHEDGYLVPSPRYGFRYEAVSRL